MKKLPTLRNDSSFAVHFSISCRSVSKTRAILLFKIKIKLIEISYVKISYVLRGIKRAISRKLVKISDCRVSSFLKTVPGCRVSRRLIFRIWKLKFKRNAQICHWLIPLFAYCRNNCTLCCKSSKEYSENCMFRRNKLMAHLWRPMLNKIGDEIKH